MAQQPEALRPAEFSSGEAVKLARSYARNCNIIEHAAHKYLQNVDHKWRPHEWVERAILAAHRMGAEAVEQERDALRAQVERLPLPSLQAVAYGRWAEGLPAGTRLMSYDGAPLVSYKPTEHYNVPLYTSPPAVAQAGVADERDLMTKIHAQIRHLIDDLTTVIEDDGLTRYVTAHGGGMPYSNFIDALIPLTKQLGAALAAQPARVAGEIADHEIAKTVNQLRDIAIEFHGAQQLRERIAHLIVPLLQRRAPVGITPGDGGS